MRKDFRFLLSGAFAGVVLGALVAFAIQHRQQSVRPAAGAVAATHHGGTSLEESSPTMPHLPNQIRDGNMSNSMASADGQPDGATTIPITPSCSMKFSAPFVKALREMKAYGESPDVLVNTVVAEFNRQRVILVNAVHRKLDRGEMDFEESQDFFHSRNEPLGKAIAQILGDDCFRHWDKERLLRSVTASGYTLTAAESDELYRIEKEHEQRNAELTRAKENGELDPLDFEAQRGKSDEQYQQARAKLVNEERRGRKENERDSTLAVLKMQTRDLNLTQQQLTELASAIRKNSQAEQELESQPRDASYAEKERALQAAAESDLIRILGPQGVEEIKKANDYRYQSMKQYRELWRLSDTDINYLYQTFAKYDKAIEEHNAQSPPVPEGENADKDATSTQIDEFAKVQRQQLEVELQRFLGEERFRRFKAAGLVPQD